ncbi:hypothetical protein GCM10027341_09710 [Spirosoma knui]
MNTNFYHTWSSLTLGGSKALAALSRPRYVYAAQRSQFIRWVSSLEGAASQWAGGLLVLLWLGLSHATNAQTPNGVTVAGGLPLAANQLNLPSGVAIDKDGNIYVADGNNNRIQKWTPGATQGTTVAGGKWHWPRSQPVILS